jgi:acetylornithine deacetylase/succinyl-diaminopimelate desuccinylase-like protein
MVSEPTMSSDTPRGPRRAGAPAGAAPTGSAAGGDGAPATTAEGEVVDLCRDLLRLDSVNRGNGDGNERLIAEYVAAKLADVGLEPTLLESEPGRTSVVTRLAGADPSRPPLLIHGHLDVVPADPAEWRLHPFAGEDADGCLWGRGAIDMKDMDAMTLAVVRDLARSGRKPPRDLVVAFVADEEAGGTLGARWLVDNHPDLFADCTEAISEVGGFSYTISEDLRLYLIQTAEKGIAWMKLAVAGRAGHGSMVNDDNAVTALCEAVARLGRHEFPVVLTPTVRRFLGELGDALGTEFDTSDLEATIAKLGPIARMIGATIRNTVNPTQLDAGHKVNVIPGEAVAHVDGRFLPGYEEEFLRQVDELIGPAVRREWVVNDHAVQTGFDGPLVDAMAGALRAEDPAARAVPYMLSGGTDAKSFSRLGIRCFGFSPLLLPPDLDFAGMFHGVDERVPMESLRFGVRVLDRFLAAS